MGEENPFRLLKMEQIDRESNFHFLFGYQMLQIFEGKAGSIWNRLQIIRSAPGGGKTSLLNLFTVDSLLGIYKYRNNEDFVNLFKTLDKLGVYRDDEPAILGVYLPCTQTFSRIEDLNAEQEVRDRLFFSLINIRALFGVLRAVCSLFQLDYPREVNLVGLDQKCYECFSRDKLLPHGNGKTLLEKGMEIERKIIEMIDSVNLSGIEDIPLLSNLPMWQIAPNCLNYNGGNIGARILFMLDDVHELTSHQRSLLLRELERNYPTARWVAERYEALGAASEIYTASTKEREYNVYKIEQWASDQRSKGLFRKGLGHIADRRVNSQKIITASTFEYLLSEELEKKHKERCNRAIDSISLRLRELICKEKRFIPWIEEVESIKVDDVYKRVSRLRALEILIQRKIRREQTLFPDYALTTLEMDKMDSASVQTAGRLFVSKEFKIPYYYGIKTLKQISSGNIEQFLSVCGDIFEELLALNTLRKSINISIGRQQSIIKRAAKIYLEQLPLKMASGVALRRLILNIGDFSRKRTFEITAPYAPGITGIAISDYDQYRLADEDFLGRYPKYRELSAVLRDAIANNVLEPRPGQQCKGQKWLVLYLNRLLCVHFNLPLEYGGWKDQDLGKMNLWLKTLAPEQKSLRWMEGS
ncbi:MAG: hypothetical protein HQP61_11010 [Peptococcaceae bacterium]|nr:hypothetical protein [Candidatus Syntrophopropionicum ammoniitolerans]